MNTKQMKEIAIWLQGKYKYGTGSSSKYLLSRIMGAEIEDGISKSFPLDGQDATRCFELYKNCEFVRNNIKTIYNEMHQGIFPIWQILFDEYYLMYEKTNTTSWGLREVTSVVNCVKLLKDNSIDFNINSDGSVTYIVGDTEYTTSKNYISRISLHHKEQLPILQKRFDLYYEVYANGGILSENNYKDIFDIASQKIPNFNYRVDDIKWIKSINDNCGKFFKK